MTDLADILDAYKNSRLSLEEACEALSRAHVTHLGHTTVDLHRERRVGAAEVIYAPGKTPQQLSEIFSALASKQQNVLATRADAAGFAAVRRDLPDAEFNETTECCGSQRGDDIQRLTTVLPVQVKAPFRRVHSQSSYTKKKTLRSRR